MQNTYLNMNCTLKEQKKNKNNKSNIHAVNYVKKKRNVHTESNGKIIGNMLSLD